MNTYTRFLIRLIMYMTVPLEPWQIIASQLWLCFEGMKCLSVAVNSRMGYALARWERLLYLTIGLAANGLRL